MAGAGLSLPLGAFLAGLLLGKTEFTHQTDVDLDPSRASCSGLFFVTIGMGLDSPKPSNICLWVLGGLVALLLRRG